MTKINLTRQRRPTNGLGFGQQSRKDVADLDVLPIAEALGQLRPAEVDRVGDPVTEQAKLVPQRGCHDDLAYFAFVNEYGANAKLMLEVHGSVNQVHSRAPDSGTY